jgi:hypothetical protein
MLSCGSVWLFSLHSSVMRALAGSQALHETRFSIRLQYSTNCQPTLPLVLGSIRAELRHCHWTSGCRRSPNPNPNPCTGWSK